MLSSLPPPTAPFIHFSSFYSISCSICFHLSSFLSFDCVGAVARVVVRANEKARKCNRQSLYVQSHPLCLFPKQTHFHNRPTFPNHPKEKKEKKATEREKRHRKPIRQQKVGNGEKKRKSERRMLIFSYALNPPTGFSLRLTTRELVFILIVCFLYFMIFFSPSPLRLRGSEKEKLWKIFIQFPSLLCLPRRLPLHGCKIEKFVIHESCSRELLTEVSGHQLKSAQLDAFALSVHIFSPLLLTFLSLFIFCCCLLVLSWIVYDGCERKMKRMRKVDRDARRDITWENRIFNSVLGSCCESFIHLLAKRPLNEMNLMIPMNRENV